MNRKTYLGRALGTSMFFALILMGFLPKPLAEAGKKEPANVLNTTKQQLVEGYGKLPLSFEANVGQTDDQVKFLSRGSGYTLFLTRRGEAVLVLRKPSPKRDLLKPIASVSMPATVNPDVAQAAATVRMKLVGANAKPRAEALGELPGKANYFISNDPKKWRANVPLYAKVRYRDVYPGVDLVYYGNQRQLEHDFIVSPGADPRSITLNLAGAEKLSLDPQGALMLAVKDGELRLDKPHIYQEVDGERREISGGYVLKNARQVSFQVAAYDARRPLVIDPTLFYSTYLGGSGDDEGYAIAVDGAGNAYVTGCAGSANFPTTSGAFQTMLRNSSPLSFGAPCGPGADAFVTKLNPTGSGLVYSTYLGGSSHDIGRGIAVDAAGDAYVVGQTYSSDFPTTPGALKTTFTKAGACGGACPCAYAFVTQLNTNGSGLVYSTFVGGSGHEDGAAIALDNAGSAYITGGTQSTDFPTTPGAFQTMVTGVGTTCSPSAGYVAKLAPTGSALVYATYLGNGGGGGGTVGHGIAVDSSGDAYVAGDTTTTNFPTTPGAFQTASGGGDDATVTKLNPFGTGLVYSTYLGGSSQDVADGIALDTLSVPNAYVTGETNSTNFPTANSLQAANAGGYDAFITKVNPLGTGLVYSTYLGGSFDDVGSGIAVDSSFNAYVTGHTNSTNFPTANPVQAANAGGSDAFVTALNPVGNGLVYSSYLGGTGDDDGTGIALDSLPNPNAYVTGLTTSANFPTTSGAFQSTFGGGTSNAFVTKIANITLPPGPTVGKVTGGGTIDVSGGIANFGFIVQAQSNTGPIGGDLQYVNHASGAKIHSVMFTTFTISGNTATFSGTCTNNGAPCTFSVTVQDNDQPEGPDSFTISINGGLPEGGTLRGGDIEIHQQ